MPIFSAADLAKLLEYQKTILVIGPPFSGKTYSLWTLVAYLKQHNLGKFHYLDLDHKVESLIYALTHESEAIKLDLINYIVVRRLAAKPRIAGKGVSKITASKDLFEDMSKQVNEYENQIDINTGKWKTDFDCGAFFIDSLSRFNEIVQEFVVATIGHDIGEKSTDARNDYVMIMNKVKQAVVGMKMLPCITGWIAHDQLIKSELDGKIILIPSVAGKDTLAPSLPKEFNCVLVSTTQKDGDKIKYVWQVQPGGWVRSAGVTSKSGLPMYVPQDYRQIL